MKEKKGEGWEMQIAVSKDECIVVGRNSCRRCPLDSNERQVAGEVTASAEDDGLLIVDAGIGEV